MVRGGSRHSAGIVPAKCLDSASVPVFLHVYQPGDKRRDQRQRCVNNQVRALSQTGNAHWLDAVGIRFLLRNMKSTLAQSLYSSGFIHSLE